MITKTRIGNHLRRHALGDQSTFRQGFKEGVKFVLKRTQQRNEEHMTQDEIIEMARQAGCFEKHQVFYFTQQDLEAFAKLVAEKERKACAEIAESKRHAPHFVLTSMPSQNGTAGDIANLIRARGQAC